MYKKFISFAFASLLLLTACTPKQDNTISEGNETGSSTSTVTSSEAAQKVAQAELAANDGKNGNKCYVAVDGIVYEISGSEFWNSMGQHTTSGGEAFCGADMSEVILKSPHGKSILTSSDKVTKIGELSQ